MRKRFASSQLNDDLSAPSADSHSGRQQHHADRTHHHDRNEHDTSTWLGEHTELYVAIASGCLLLAGWVFDTFTASNASLVWILYLLAILAGGLFTVREAIANVLRMRFEIDSLMLVAAAGAMAISKYFEAAVLLFLFSLGHALEHYAMGRARRAIEALSKLTPEVAMVVRDGQTVEVAIADLVVGDRVIVKPNERIPVDGIVVKGESAVNQAPITGESIPVDKSPIAEPIRLTKASERSNPRVNARHRVFAGTINGAGALEIKVTKLSTDSTLARVINMVSQAETQKSPTQRFTDRFERWFVAVALGLGFVLMFAWVVLDEPFRASFYRAMSVLVAASPCALAIATPSAVLSAVATAARRGVLVKGGAALETLGRIDAIAFDKTGTLTEGKPRLVEIVPSAGVTDEQLLDVALAVESLSDHPLAQAVVHGATERLDRESKLDASDVKEIVGKGVTATINQQAVLIGNAKLFVEDGASVLTAEFLATVDRLKASGKTIMIVRMGGEYLGVLGLMDTPRPAAKQVIARLHELGIQRTIMLSGDNQQVADAVAREVGIKQAIGEMMPEDKVRAIQELSRGAGVAMVGDGVNDAPALAMASIGIAMGAAGSDVALETADVALMADDLNHLPFAIGLARQTNRIIQQNLWFAIGMVVFLVPATLLGLTIGPAVFLHEGSTVAVVFNALRLLAYRDKHSESLAPSSA